MKQELKTREQLEKSIKEQHPYYRGADLSAHTIEQLWKILWRKESHVKQDNTT